MEAITPVTRPLPMPAYGNSPDAGEILSNLGGRAAHCSPPPGNLENAREIGFPPAAQFEKKLSPNTCVPWEVLVRYAQFLSNQEG